MSRIGKKPIPVPDKTDVKIEGAKVEVKGPLGTLARTFKGVTVELADGQLTVIPAGETRDHKALWGLGRSLLNNMVIGCSTGFQKVLEINGVGYRAESKGKVVNFQLGYSHPIAFPVPEGITIDVEKQVTLTIKGIDKQLVGETAAKIRSLRPPEPYKGKGIKYADEIIRRKAGKAAA